VKKDFWVKLMISFVCKIDKDCLCEIKVLDIVEILKTGKILEKIIVIHMDI